MVGISGEGIQIDASLTFSLAPWAFGLSPERMDVTAGRVHEDWAWVLSQMRPEAARLSNPGEVFLSYP